MEHDKIKAIPVQQYIDSLGLTTDKHIHTLINPMEISRLYMYDTTKQLYSDNLKSMHGKKVYVKFGVENYAYNLSSMHDDDMDTWIRETRKDCVDGEYLVLVDSENRVSLQLLGTDDMPFSAYHNLIESIHPLHEKYSDREGNYICQH